MVAATMFSAGTTAAEGTVKAASGKSGAKEKVAEYKAAAATRAAEEEHPREDPDWKFLEQQLESSLGPMQHALASMQMPTESRAAILDDLAESAMASIQSSMKSSASRLLLYRHFRRLHVVLRSRIESWVP